MQFVAGPGAARCDEETSAQRPDDYRRNADDGESGYRLGHLDWHVLRLALWTDTQQCQTTLLRRDLSGSRRSASP